MAGSSGAIAGWRCREKVPLWAQTEGCNIRLICPWSSALRKSRPATRPRGCKGDTMTDLTGGLGVDCSFLARNFRKWITWNVRKCCELARHNFPLLGLPQVTVHCADGVEYLQRWNRWIACSWTRPVATVRGKTVAIADCEPDVQKLEPLLVEKAGRGSGGFHPCWIFSSLRELKYIRQIHVVAVNNECKELLVVLQKTKSPVQKALERCG